MTVNISAAFTKEERIYNGLLAIEKELVTDPLTDHVIVAVIETKSITEDIENGGVKTPTVRLARVEALDGDAAATVRELLDAAYRARTGKPEAPQGQLPFAGDQADEGPVSTRDPDVWLDDVAERAEG